MGIRKYWKDIDEGRHENVRPRPIHHGHADGQRNHGGGRALWGQGMEIGAEGLSEFLDGFVRGIERRGKCRPGDRTLLTLADVAA